MVERDLDAPGLNKIRIEFKLVIPPSRYSSKVMEPGKQAIHIPLPLISPQRAAIPGRINSSPVHSMWSNQFDASPGSLNFHLYYVYVKRLPRHDGCK